MFNRLRQRLFRFMVQCLLRGVSPSEATVFLASTGPVLSRCLYVVAELGVADRLKSGPLTAQQLASALCVDPDALTRVLLALTPTGYFRRDRSGFFRNTPQSRALMTDHPGSLREWVRYAGAPWQWKHWGDLLETVEKGGELRCGLLFDWVETNPEIRSQFNAAMQSKAKQIDERIVELFDFSHFRRVVDVGGGNGHFAHQLVKREPGVKATVFDIPPTISSLRKACPFGPSHDRIDLAEGDFFKSVPEGGDLYLIRHVLHNWPDSQARMILENCRKAMKPSASLLVVDMLLNQNELAPRSMDVAMLHLLGGRERTAEQFKALFQQAGFELTSVQRTSTPMSLLVASVAAQSPILVPAHSG
jgi:ubiquinone/menaquinone biosynthesis C-methylase UbiE